VTYSLAVDIGGTFTDIVLRHSSGVLTVDKVLTTHHDLLEGFFAGVSNVMKAAKIGPREVDGVVVHATTIVTNVLIERKGRPTALQVSATSCISATSIAMKCTIRRSSLPIRWCHRS
jgi:N-methylhydantoinase A